MKKTLSLIMAVIMVLTLLTGCSTDEFGYLKLMTEMSKVKQYNFESTTKVSFGEEFMGERMDVSVEMIGEANVEDYKDMYLNAMLNVNYNDYVGKEQVEVKLAGNKLYASTNLFDEANNIYLEQGIEDEEFAKHYDEIMKYDYWLIHDLAKDMKEAKVEDVDLDLVYEEITTLMNKTFKNFDSKLVTDIDNGYKIEVTDESGKDAVNSLVKYIKDNRKEILSILDEKPGENLDEAQLKQLREILGDVEQQLDELDTMITPEMVDAYAQMIKGSKLTLELTKKDGVYSQKMYLTIVANGSKFGTFETITSITPADVSKTAVQGKILTEEVLNSIVGVETPVEGQVYGMSIHWKNNSDETAVEAYKNGGMTSIGKSNYVIIEDRVYLPLRYVGETLGEEVGWDNDLRQAYVLRNGERIDMTGVIVNDKTMVKLRDFEKLGYTVDYEQVDGISTAYITDYNKMMD